MKTTQLVLAAAIGVTSLSSARAQPAPADPVPSSSSNTPSMADKKDCPPRRLVLPLDHGPRAQSTPYLNKQRKDRYEAQVKACEEAKR